MGASLPSVSAEERSRARGDVEPHGALTSDRTTLTPEQAIERYRDRIRQIYLANGKKETLLSDQITKLDTAVKELLGDLTPQFDANAFDKLSLAEKINTLSTAFFNCGYVVGHSAGSRERFSHYQKHFLDAHFEGWENARSGKLTLKRFS